MPESKKVFSTTTNWLYTYTKISFFARIRRFLLVKANSSSKKQQFGPSDHLFDDNNPRIIINTRTASYGNSKVSEVPDMQQQQVVAVKEKEENGWTVLQRSVKKLHFGSWEEKEMAMESIKKLARNDSKTKKSLAELGVIPPLIGMIQSEKQSLAVQTLIQLANGSFT